MAIQHEVLIPKSGTARSKDYMESIAAALRRMGYVVRNNNWYYKGDGKVLFLYGVGAPEREHARRQQTRRRRHTVSFDLGYFNRQDYMRVSITKDHPSPSMIDMTPRNGERLSVHQVALGEYHDRYGPIILIGQGRKSHVRGDSFLGWEQSALLNLKQRFPTKEILYRPKPSSRAYELPLGIPTLSPDKPIEEVIRGASLVVCRHSNVAVDAVVNGIPFECMDGAAKWLEGKPYTLDNRIDFLRRLAYWQWRQDEAAQCIEFVFDMIDRIPKPRSPRAQPT